MTYVEEYITRAKAAQKAIEHYTQPQVDALVKAMGKIIFDRAEELSREAVEETGYGTVESKVLKHRKCTLAAWFYLHDKKSVGAIENDPVNQLVTYAKPVGVVAALVPTTNPTSTTVSNGMSIIKCRNAMIVSPHPRAVKVTTHCVELIRDAIGALGAPRDLVQIIDQPSMDTTHELMAKADVVVATGGSAMVKAAYSSGRPSYGVGQGNVQVVLADDYTDLAFMAKTIIGSRAYDNGLPCTGEQAIHAPEGKVDAVIKALLENGAALLTPEQAKAFETFQFKENGAINPVHVGMTAHALAKEVGASVPEDAKVLIFRSLGMTNENLLRKEKLNPVIQIFPYKTYEEGVANAKANLEWEGIGHSAVVYTNDSARAEYAGEQLPVSRVLVNQPGGAASGGNLINGLNPTMSLGCGSWGNNSISENLTYKHLMNTTRLAYFHPSTLPSPEKVWEL